jgi:anti-sigma28 factor (negative regulator of flagellin synthesis)
MIHRIPGQKVNITPEINTRNGNIKAYKSDKQQNVLKTGTKDSVMLSRESLTAVEVSRYCEIAKTMPDMDLEHIKEVKQKIKNGEYFSSDIAGTTAERMLEHFE